MISVPCSWSAALATSGRDWVAYRPFASPRCCEYRRGQVQTSASTRRGYGDLRDPWRDEERRQALLKYVQEVQPQSVVQFAEQTHPVVVQAMRQTVLNVVGSLPPQYFEVRISAVAESLAQLMLSIMTTGYMLRSAQFRMELQNSLKQLPTHTSAGAAAAPAAGPAAAAAGPAAALPTVAAFSPADYGSGSAATATTAADVIASGYSSSGSSSSVLVPTTTAFLYDGDGSPYAPGVQKKNVEGEVLRWHLARGEVERLAAADYIELLEREVAALRAQVGQGQAAASQPPPSSAPAPGAIEVLGPDTPTSPQPWSPTRGGSAASSHSQSQALACVSPLPGFGERAGAGLPLGLAASAAASAASSSGVSAAAPATMGCGGIPLVVGSPLGLPRNELLDYLHGLQASDQGGFKELACSPTAASGEAVKEAMELFVARLMGTIDPEALTRLNSEFTAVELSKVLFWLMAVGYTLKSIESRLELDDGSDGISSGSSGGGAGPGWGPGTGNGSSGGKPGGCSSNGKGGGKDSKNRKGGFGGLRGLLPGF